MKNYSIALFGAGNHGLNAVLPAILKLPERLTLSAIVEPFEVNAQSASAAAPGVPVFSSADELFAAQTPDLAYIATLPKSHASLAVQALEAGCHVVCEKPLAPTVEECELMVNTAQNANRVLATMFESRYYPHYRQIREWILAGKIGRVEAIHQQHFWPGPVTEPRRTDLLNATGSLDCGIHLLDLARFFVDGGEWETVHALGQWFDEPHLANPPHISILARLENGPQVTQEDSMSYRIGYAKRSGDRNGPASLMIIGTEGVIEKVDGGYRLWADDKEEFCSSHHLSHADEIPFVLADVLSVIENGQSQSGVLPTGRDGLIAQRIVAEANRQANASRRI